ncbi:unnamed protein product [Heligmosomoides polygyrus]|uniref:Uncharacterized protein n=1 Tax=Heligmosomoides polygyrus TaxID=6339 RepID=A0A3P7TL46_HELPZ|nr:unnamed protein product [Heligmosomoides polygyrus]
MGSALGSILISKAIFAVLFLKLRCLQDKSAPEQSCTNFIKRDGDGSFPVVSLTFNLKESPEMDDFPEDSFRDTVAGALRVNPADILILRVNCQGTEDTLTVQFGVLKKDEDSDDADIMFVDAESVATRMKAMGHLSQIADLQVDTIEFVSCSSLLR